ncbi:hypothetical protein DV736_g4046, partial [Chaetothyriales sp. CBS 134916]
MGTPRRSARVAAQDSTPNYNEDDLLAGRKRKSDAAVTSPSAKRGKKSTSNKDQRPDKASAIELERQANEKPEPNANDAPAEAEPEAANPSGDDKQGGVEDAIADESKEPAKSDVAAEASPQVAAATSAADVNAPSSEVADKSSENSEPQKSDEPAAKQAPVLSDLPSRAADAVLTKPNTAGQSTALAEEGVSVPPPAVEHRVNGASAAADKPAGDTDSNESAANAAPAPPADQTDPTQSFGDGEKAPGSEKN